MPQVTGFSLMFKEASRLLCGRALTVGKVSESPALDRRGHLKVKFTVRGRVLSALPHCGWQFRAPYESPSCHLCQPCLLAQQCLWSDSFFLFSKQRCVLSKSNFELRFWGNKVCVYDKHSGGFSFQFCPHETKRDRTSSPRSLALSSQPLTSFLRRPSCL